MKPCVLGIILFISFILGGCGDVKDIQSILIVTALGLDYQNGKYIGYLQTVDFKNVAKMEGGYQGEPVMYVGKGTGSTPDEAISRILKTAQQEVYLKHITAVLLHERVIKKGYDNIYDSLARHPEMTISPWIVATRESINKVMLVQGFFNRTSLQSILHKPLLIYNQYSILKPKQMFEFHRELYEPNYTTYLPSLKIDEKQWGKNKKKEHKLAYEGAFFIKNGSFKGFVPLSKMTGFYWITRGTETIPLTTSGLTVLVSPNIKMKETVSNHQPGFKVTVEGKGSISERNSNDMKSLNQVERAVNSKIKQEIKKLYEIGQKTNTDFLNLEHTLYRDDYHTWSKFYNHSHGSKPDLLKEIEVHISIKHSNSNKNKKLNMKDIQ